jgi:hypothetical protein
MTTANFCFYLQDRLIQTSQTGGQWYSDTSPFSIPWLKTPCFSFPLMDAVKMPKQAVIQFRKCHSFRERKKDGHDGLAGNGVGGN